MLDREFTLYTLFTPLFTLTKWIYQPSRGPKVKRVNSISTFLVPEKKLNALISVLEKNNPLFPFTLFTFSLQARISGRFHRVNSWVNSLLKISPFSPYGTGSLAVLDALTWLSHVYVSNNLKGIATL